MKWRMAFRKTVKILVSLMMAFLLILLILSLAAKESVRVRIFFDGHPITAVKCNPQYSKVQSRAFHETVYVIPLKYGYNSSDESYPVTQYQVKKRGVIWVAHHIIPRM